MTVDRLTREQVIARLADAFGNHKIYDPDKGECIPSGKDEWGIPLVLDHDSQFGSYARTPSYGEIADAILKGD